jgi:hypothetical protein
MVSPMAIRNSDNDFNRFGQKNEDLSQIQLGECFGIEVVQPSGLEWRIMKAAQPARAE